MYLFITYTLYETIISFLFCFPWVCLVALKEVQYKFLLLFTSYRSCGLPIELCKLCYFSMAGRTVSKYGNMMKRDNGERGGNTRVSFNIQHIC